MKRPDIDGMLRYEPPVVSAIYFLSLGDEVVYVGKTENLAQRIGYHTQSKAFAFDTVHYVVTPLDRLAVVERRWINELKPKHNELGRRKGAYLAQINERNLRRAKRLEERRLRFEPIAIAYAAEK